MFPQQMALVESSISRDVSTDAAHTAEVSQVPPANVKRKMVRRAGRIFAIVVLALEGSTHLVVTLHVLLRTYKRFKCNITIYIANFIEPTYTYIIQTAKREHPLRTFTSMKTFLIPSPFPHPSAPPSPPNKDNP